MGAFPDPRERSKETDPQPELPFASEPPVPAAQVTRLTVWTHRLSLVIVVVFCIELGMLLAVLPWTKVWTDNSLLLSYPAWLGVLRSQFTRGAITGLGLIDIWIGIWEAVHYSDPKGVKA